MTTTNSAHTQLASPPAVSCGNYPALCHHIDTWQMEVAQVLAQQNPDLHIQTHLSENDAEIELTLQLYPKAKDYTDVYAHYGLLGPQTLLGHAIHLSQRERAVIAESESIAVHCPTSNLFLGSGLYDLESLSADDVRLAIATDIGGGTSYSDVAHVG